MYNQLAMLASSSSSSSSSSSFSYQEFLKILESDVQQANSLASAIPVGKNGMRLQMKLVHNNLASFLLLLFQWLNYSCSCLIPRYLNLFHVLVFKVHSDGQPKKFTTHGRKATISEFYGVILPSLQQLHSNLDQLENASNSDSGRDLKRLNKKITREGRSFSNLGLEREEECGICLETSPKMVLPSCCHSMCIKCYRSWNLKSESCPFCRGSIKRVNSEDLWVLADYDDVVDAKTVSREDLLRFYLYINSLPKDYPDALFLVYYEYSNLI